LKILLFLKLPDSFGFLGKYKNRIFEKIKLGKVKELYKCNDLKLVVRFSDIGNIKEIYEWRVYDYLKLSSSSIVIDIGAHIGLFAVKVARKVKKVVAIEPHPENFKLLLANVRLNHLKNVTAINAAIGREMEKLFFLVMGEEHRFILQKKLIESKQQ